MISVLIFTRNSEGLLAQTLSALVPAVVEGLLRRVVVVDRASTDETRLVAEGAGCSLYDETDLQSAFDDLRTDWLLLLKPGAILANGWEDAVRGHMEMSQSPARFSSPQDLGLMGKLLGAKPSLDNGLLAPVITIRPVVGDGGVPGAVLKRLKPIRLPHQILPPKTTKGGA